MRIFIMLAFLFAFITLHSAKVYAQPEMLTPDLQVNAVVSGLFTPSAIAFTDSNEFLVIEKNTGLVKYVVNGALQNIALDLPVNFGSERGLLGIALHPDFASNNFVYLFWTESTTGADNNVLNSTPLLGNRVDRFIWNGTSLTFDLNLLRIRALQEDAGQTPRGNHNGGVLKFGPDGKLYIFTGDLGRRGWLQNLPCGPTADCPGNTVPDDQFGGPAPDNAHFSGVIMRLNDDGTAPTDNPFFASGGAVGGEAGNNIQKIFSYGHRNSFGMDFSPQTGVLWMSENGDDSFSEINSVMPGMNSGWIQIMGPADRIGQFKEIETSTEFFGLQQIRWSPENIADTPDTAKSRLFMLPGAHYSDPEFSWKYDVSPAGIGFVNGRGLGAQFEGNLFVGAASTQLEGGHLFRLKLTGNGRKIAVDDNRRLKDRVADNTDKWDITESESLLIGKNFGVSTDIKTGPDGNLYIVSISTGSVYKISRKGSIAKENGQTINSFALSQNYPNPFNPSTVIKYSVAEAGFVTLKIYDLLGRETAVLVNENTDPGEYEVNFDASGLISGTYFYKLTSGSFTETRKMMFLK